MALTKVIATFNEQIEVLEQQVSVSFRGHPDAGIDPSQPSLGPILGARLLGDSEMTRTGMPAPEAARTTPRPARSPASPGNVRWCRRATPATTGSPTDEPWAFVSPRASPGARAHYDELRARGKTHGSALRPARQPAGRHLARLPPGRPLPRRAHRLGTPLRHARASRRLILHRTRPPPGVLSLTPQDGGMSCARANGNTVVGSHG